MGLSDFERELASNREKKPSRHRDRSRDRDERRSEGSRHHHHSSRHDSHDDHDTRGSDRRHRHKRRRHDDDDDDSEERRKRRAERHARNADQNGRKGSQAAGNIDEDSGTAGAGVSAGQADEVLDERLASSDARNLERDTWMQAPSSVDVDYVQRKRSSPPPSHAASTMKDYQLKVHENELNQHLRGIGRDDNPGVKEEESSQEEVTYEFGDSGSQWRMTKLRSLQRQAKEAGKPVEELALERYGSLREFDNAREEEIELERRKVYGSEYVGKIKPSGELFDERRLKAASDRSIHARRSPEEPRQLPQGEVIDEQAPPAKTIPLDQTALNKLKARMMKARLRGGTEAAQLEIEYNAALAGAANRADPEVIVLSTMDSRMLAGGRKGEVKTIENKRGRERGLVEENEDMSIDDMVRQERRTRGAPGGAGAEMAQRIAKDAKFDNDLDYMEENAEKLSKRVAQSDINLRNTAISDFQKMTKILESCPLCHHEDRNPPLPPVAPLIALATRVYLTLPTEPEISEGGAVIVPIQHRLNLLECDDDEWDEIRNFMKCLTRMYHDQGRDVIFYENAASPGRKRHAALQAVPLPYEMGQTAPAFFREAILSADEEWSQHKKVIDTLKRSKEGLGKLAFRRTLAKEMPYFHVWFELDGGLGHIVEDERRWPKGDLFAREIVGGMLDVGPEIVRRQGKWHKEDRRQDGFKKRWRKFDWTRVLTEG